MTSFGIYIHVPFCRDRKCPYCDFYSVASPGPGLVERYLDVLEAELARSVERYPENLGVGSIYFGGGTPSLLEPEQVWRVYCRIKSLWQILPGAEVTLECNPEDLLLRRAAGYFSAGVNRLSLGCQSFDERQLELLGRSHSAADCRAAVGNACEAGFGRLSLDLIFGGPQSTEGALLEAVGTALDLGVSHLSLYGYHLERTAPAYGRAELAPAGEELYRSQYLAACRKLEDSGWRHYEISNWAASPDEYCRHNLAYWLRRPCLGCGPAAHSFLPPDLRFWNPEDLEEYLKGGGGDKLSDGRSERLDSEQVLCEEIMLGLRLESGVEPAAIGAFLGGELETTLQALREEGLGAVSGAGRFVLSERGWLIYDEVLGRLTRKERPSG
ncbi:MAG: radical SAM family heme chaperone HemW [Candidatus Glassbacteria bacterium]|nr:radical SAM family heme chaperone HemW [Candidatus Glassbacteria bacterium]